MSCSSGGSPPVHDDPGRPETIERPSPRHTSATAVARIKWKCKYCPTEIPDVLADFIFNKCPVCGKDQPEEPPPTVSDACDEVPVDPNQADDIANVLVEDARDGIASKNEIGKMKSVNSVPGDTTVGPGSPPDLLSSLNPDLSCDPSVSQSGDHGNQTDQVAKKRSRDSKIQSLSPPSKKTFLQGKQNYSGEALLSSSLILTSTEESSIPSDHADVSSTVTIIEHVSSPREEKQKDHQDTNQLPLDSYCSGSSEGHLLVEQLPPDGQPQKYQVHSGSCESQSQLLTESQPQEDRLPSESQPRTNLISPESQLQADKICHSPPCSHPHADQLDHGILESQSEQLDHGAPECQVQTNQLGAPKGHLQMDQLDHGTIEGQSRTDHLDHGATEGQSPADQLHHGATECHSRVDKLNHGAPEHQSQANQHGVPKGHLQMDHDHGATEGQSQADHLDHDTTEGQLPADQLHHGATEYQSRTDKLDHGAPEHQSQANQLGAPEGHSLMDQLDHGATEGHPQADHLDHGVTKSQSPADQDQGATEGQLRADHIDHGMPESQSPADHLDHGATEGQSRADHLDHGAKGQSPADQLHLYVTERQSQVDKLDHGASQTNQLGAPKGCLEMDQLDCGTTDGQSQADHLDHVATEGQSPVDQLQHGGTERQSQADHLDHGATEDQPQADCLDHGTTECQLRADKLDLSVGEGQLQADHHDHGTSEGKPQADHFDCDATEGQSQADQLHHGSPKNQSLANQIPSDGQPQTDQLHSGSSECQTRTDHDSLVDKVSSESQPQAHSAKKDLTVHEPKVEKLEDRLHESSQSADNTDRVKGDLYMKPSLSEHGSTRPPKGKPEGRRNGPSSNTRSQAAALIPGVHDNKEQCMVVTFNVIVPIQYWDYDKYSSRVRLRFGHLRLGNWSHDVGNFSIQSEADDGRLLVMQCELNIEVSLLQRPIPYKYCVYTQHQSEDRDHYEDLHEASKKYGHHINRCLLIPHEHLQLKGVYYLYDGMVLPRVPSASFFTKFTRIVGFGRSDAEKELPKHDQVQEKALLTFLVKQKQAIMECNLLGKAKMKFKRRAISILHIFKQLRDQNLCYGYSHKLGEDIWRAINLDKVFVNWLLEIIRHLESVDIKSCHDSGKRMCSVLLIIFLLKELHVHRSIYYSLKPENIMPLFIMLRMNPQEVHQEQKWKSEELTVVLNFIPCNLYDKLAACLVQFTNCFIEARQLREPQWLYIIPLVHILKNRIEPFGKAEIKYGAIKWKDDSINLIPAKRASQNSSFIENMYEDLKPLTYLDPLLLPQLVYLCPNHELSFLFRHIPTYLSTAFLIFIIRDDVRGNKIMPKQVT